MRDSDSELSPEAKARIKRENILFVSGLVIAACGLVAVFILHEVYLGFGVALVGTGIVPFDKIASYIKR